MDVVAVKLGAVQVHHHAVIRTTRRLRRVNPAASLTSKHAEIVVTYLLFTSARSHHGRFTPSP